MASKEWLEQAARAARSHRDWFEREVADWRRSYTPDEIERINEDGVESIAFAREELEAFRKFLSDLVVALDKLQRGQ